MSCTFACGVNAINHNMVIRHEVIKAGAIILAPGYQIYKAELSEEYGFGRFPNVITSLQYERILSASGPTRGHLKRPSDSKPPEEDCISCNAWAAVTRVTITARRCAACTRLKKLS
jgi:heterodisulfide reductase subunit A2